jgi:hypothetical protein
MEDKAQADFLDAVLVKVIALYNDIAAFRAEFAELRTEMRAGFDCLDRRRVEP